jgi:hypothetical protein
VPKQRRLNERNQMIPAVERSRHGSVREIPIAICYVECQTPLCRRKNAAARWRLRFW